MNINATRGIALNNFKKKSDRTNIKNLFDRLITDLDVNPDSNDCPEFKEELSINENIEATLRHARNHLQRESDMEDISKLLNKLNGIVRTTKEN